MPYLSINGNDIWYEDTGTGTESIVFSHGLLMSHAMFEPQVRDLSGDYRCIRFDHRGQGRSNTSETGYDMDSLAEDAAEIIRATGANPCHFVGLSMGGFVGLRLAARHPELLRSLTLIGSMAAAEPAAHRFRYRIMLWSARHFGFKHLLGRITPLMFGKTFLHNPAAETLREDWRKSLLSSDNEGILRACRGVIERDDFSARLGDIQTRTLILVGEEDLTTPLSQSRRMHSAIAGSKLVVIPEAGHSATLEQPERVSAALLDFMVGLESKSATLEPVKK